jgi:hypothetical protein
LLLRIFAKLEALNLSRGYLCGARRCFKVLRDDYIKDSVAGVSTDIGEI